MSLISAGSISLDSTFNGRSCFIEAQIINPKNVPHRESEGVRSFRWRGQGRKRGSAGWTRTRQVGTTYTQYSPEGSISDPDPIDCHPGSGSKSFYGSDFTTGTAQIEK